jgi:hypothetical protein
LAGSPAQSFIILTLSPVIVIVLVVSICRRAYLNAEISGKPVNKGFSIHTTDIATSAIPKLRRFGTIVRIARQRHAAKAWRQAGLARMARNLRSRARVAVPMGARNT